MGEREGAPPSPAPVAAEDRPGGGAARSAGVGWEGRALAGSDTGMHKTPGTGGLESAERFE